MTNYIKMMRDDLGISRAEFSRRYDIPKRTLEAWEAGDREAPDYVIDLLGRAVYSDWMNKKAKFYVVAIGEVDEWDCGSFDSYMEAFRTATDEWEKRTPSHVHEVEIRLYVEDVEEEDCECFDCNTVTFKTTEE
jgi:transcriptional regulator with XRE-family HTH domain